MGFFVVSKGFLAFNIFPGNLVNIGKRDALFFVHLWDAKVGSVRLYRDGVTTKIPELKAHINNVAQLRKTRGSLNINAQHRARNALLDIRNLQVIKKRTCGFIDSLRATALHLCNGCRKIVVGKTTRKANASMVSESLHAVGVAERARSISKLLYDRKLYRLLAQRSFLPGIKQRFNSVTVFVDLADDGLIINKKSRYDKRICVLNSLIDIHTLSLWWVRISSTYKYLP